jgi:hypothetical protein
MNLLWLQRLDCKLLLLITFRQHQIRSNPLSSVGSLD